MHSGGNGEGAHPAAAVAGMGPRRRERAERLPGRRVNALLAALQLLLLLSEISPVLASLLHHLCSLRRSLPVPQDARLCRSPRRRALRCCSRHGQCGRLCCCCQSPLLALHSATVADSTVVRLTRDCSDSIRSSLHALCELAPPSDFRNPKQHAPPAARDGTDNDSSLAAPAPSRMPDRPLAAASVT